jgi:hypothetical protein
VAERVEVPDFVGFTVRIARRLGHESGLVVTGPDPDGPPLGALTWPGTWIVTSQDPAAGKRIERGEQVVVRFEFEEERDGGGPAAVREPRRPSPSPLSASEEAEVERAVGTGSPGMTGGAGMSLNDRLGGVLRREFGLLRELRESQQELAVVHARLRMRLADLEHQASDAEQHYRQAVDEGDPEAELLRDWPVRIRARIEEVKAAASDLEVTEARIVERIRHAERDIEDFRILQPQIVARVAAARTAGVGREVFETLADALSYVELALAAAEPVDVNGPLSAERSGRPERSAEAAETAEAPEAQNTAGTADDPESITSTEP